MIIKNRDIIKIKKEKEIYKILCNIREMKENINKLS